MPSDWDETDEHGNPPSPIVGFCQFAFGQRAEDDLRARFGDSAPEHEVVACLTDQKRIRAVAESVLREVSRRHPVWVEEQHRYRAGFLRRLRNAYGPGLDGLETYIELCIDVVRDIDRRGDVSIVGGVLLDLHGRACLAAREVHSLLANGFPQGALGAWRTIHEASVYASLLGEHGHRDHDRLARRWLAFVDIQRHRDAVVYQELAERIEHEPLTDDEMAESQARAEAAEEEWGPAIRKQPNGWASEMTAPAPPTFDRLEALAGRGHLRGHYRWASHRVHADGRGNETNFYRRGDQVGRLVGPTNTGTFVDAVDLTLGSLRVTTNALLLNGRADAPHAGEIVAADLLWLLRDRVVDAFVEGDAIVTEAERQITEESVHEPLEDVSAWWPRPSGRSAPGV